MALSNWDTLAIDQHSRSTNGVLQSERTDWKVEIYKNWLYVHSPKAWQENSSFAYPCVMEIHEGSMRIGPFNILAARGPHNGIFAIAWENIYRQEADKMILNHVNLMVGCGIYGWSYDPDDQQDPHFQTSYRCEDDSVVPLWVTTERQNELSLDMIRTQWAEDMTKEGRSVWGPSCPVEVIVENVGSPVFVGVSEEDVKMLVTMFNSTELAKTMTLDFSEAKRFNQGDMYIAAKTNQDVNDVTTRPGQAQQTLMSQLLAQQEAGNGRTQAEEG